MDRECRAPVSLRVLILPKWYPWPDRPVFGLFCREHARAAALHNDVRVLAFSARAHVGARVFRVLGRPREPLRRAADLSPPARARRRRWRRS